MSAARTRLLAAAGALALAGLLAACGSTGSDADSADASTTAAEVDQTTTTEAAPVESTTTAGGETTTTLSSEGRDTETSQLDTLEDGIHYGYMAGLEEGTVEGTPVSVVLFDKVDFLTGDEAVAAAQEDGVIPADQDFIENDYYIRNNNQTIRRLAVVPDASITSLQGGSSDTVPSSVDEVWNQEYLFKIDVGNVRGITTISSIEAVYLP